MDRETFWNYMQRHWERTLHAEECLIISGDDIPVEESAVVISVRPLILIHQQKDTDRPESPGVFRLLPRSSPSDPERNVG